MTRDSRQVDDLGVSSGDQLTEQQGAAVEGNYPEGCTPVDFDVLRKANVDFATENQHLRQALRFYANRHHFWLSRSTAWDTVSGEPKNFWCDEAGTATVEDGSVAALALRGEPIAWEGDEPPLIEGEPEYEASRTTAPDSRDAITPQVE